LALVGGVRSGSATTWIPSPEKLWTKTLSMQQRARTWMPCAVTAFFDDATTAISRRTAQSPLPPSAEVVTFSTTMPVTPGSAFSTQVALSPYPTSPWRIICLRIVTGAESR
jgi:hypothetical protein